MSLQQLASHANSEELHFKLEFRGQNTLEKSYKKKRRTPFKLFAYLRNYQKLNKEHARFRQEILFPLHVNLM